MKKQFSNIHFESADSGNFSREGIPHKLLMEVQENSRIYKHLITVVLAANMAVASMVISFISL